MWVSEMDETWCSWYIACVNRYRSVVSSTTLKPPIVSLSKKLYLPCLVLVCHRKEFERDFTIILNYWEPYGGLTFMSNKCGLVKYRPNQTCLHHVTCAARTKHVCIMWLVLPKPNMFASCDLCCPNQTCLHHVTCAGQPYGGFTVQNVCA